MVSEREWLLPMAVRFFPEEEERAERFLLPDFSYPIEIEPAHEAGSIFILIFSAEWKA